MMWRAFGPEAGGHRFIDFVHVGSVFDAAAHWCGKKAEHVRSHCVAAEATRFLPAFLRHEVPAFGDLVEIIYFKGDMIDARSIGAVAKEELVMIGFAFALQERSRRGDVFHRLEMQPVDVEARGFGGARFRNIQSDVDDSERPGAFVAAMAVVPALSDTPTGSGRATRKPIEKPVRSVVASVPSGLRAVTSRSAAI